MNVRFLTAEETPLFRELRLYALQESPASFGSSYEIELALPLPDFASKVRPANDSQSGVLGAFAASGNLAGMLGFLRDLRPKRTHIATLWTMYIRPEFRGKKLGVALVDKAIEHAKQLGLRQLLLTVTDGNRPAQALYRSRGFERFGFEPDALLIDGVFYGQEHMVLELKRSHRETPT